MNDTEVKLRQDKIFWCAFALGSVLMLIFIVYFTLIQPDAAGCYARMVREFGVGRYKFAFYPAIPPLLIIFSGIVAKIGFEAFTAIKITCALFYLLGLFPLRSIMRRIMPENLASWTCFVYVISFYIVKHIVWGMPFALKMFFLLTSAYFVIKFAERHKIIFAAMLGLSLGLLALSRAECIAFLPFFVFWFFILPLLPKYRLTDSKQDNSVKKQNECSIGFILKKQFIGAIVIVVVFIAVCLPQMIYIYKNTGIPVTEKRAAQEVGRIVKDVFKVNLSSKINNVAKIKSRVDSLKIISSLPSYTLGRRIFEAAKGMYPFFLILVFLGLIWKFKKRKFCILDLFYASVILYNSALFLFTVNIIDYRYTAVTQVFEFGWVVLGAYFVYSWKLFPINKWNKLMLIAFIAVVIGLLIDTTTYLRKQIYRW